MPSQVVRVKIVSSWMMSLYMEYSGTLNRFQPVTSHEELLQTHAIALCRTLKARLLNTSQLHYTIGFTEPEALAFIQWWEISPLVVGSLAHVAVNDIIQCIDKVAKRPRILPLTA